MVSVMKSPNITSRWPCSDRRRRSGWCSSRGTNDRLQEERDGGSALPRPGPAFQCHHRDPWPVRELRPHEPDRAGGWTGTATVKKRYYDTYENQELVRLNRR